MNKLFYSLAVLIGIAACSVDIDYSGPTDDWSNYGKEAGGGHYSRATQITPDNVADLEQAWIYESPDSRLAGEDTLERTEYPLPATSFQTTPILVDDTLYFCTAYNRVVALDPETGEEKWNYDPKLNSRMVVLTNCRGVSSWKDPSGATGACSHRIITGTLDSRLIALDALSGEVCKGFGDQGVVDLTDGLNPHRQYEYSVTSPPAILDNKAIVGASISDSARIDIPSGVVRAYDVVSGELLWFWDAIPPGREARLDLSEGQKYEAGTTNVWSIISVDRERNLVFLPTGNTFADYYGGDRDGLDYYSSSVVALNGDTGKVVWHFQMVHHDIWDYDTASQPTLYDFERDGKIIPALAQPTKMGHLFLLNRETGEPLFPVEERPVPQGGAVPGETLSPTQPFPTIPAPLHPHYFTKDDIKVPPWDQASCEEQLAGFNNEGIFTPPSLQGSVLYPSNGGGNNWGAPAIDPIRNTAILNTVYQATVAKLTKRAECPASGGLLQLGSPYCASIAPMMSSTGYPCSGTPMGTLVAVDLKSGVKRWEIPLGTIEDFLPVIGRFFEGSPSIGGPAVTASGLTFIASTVDYYLRAFSTETGEELWKGRLPNSGMATAMTYRASADAKQYVVIAAGGHGQVPKFFDDDAGAYVVAFALRD